MPKASALHAQVPRASSFWFGRTRPRSEGDPVQRSGTFPLLRSGTPPPPLWDVRLLRSGTPRFEAPLPASRRPSRRSPFPASGGSPSPLRGSSPRGSLPTQEAHLSTPASNLGVASFDGSPQPGRHVNHYAKNWTKNSPICPIRGFRVFSSSITARPPISPLHITCSSLYLFRVYIVANPPYRPDGQITQVFVHFCRKRVGSQSEGLSESERAEKGSWPHGETQEPGASGRAGRGRGAGLAARRSAGTGRAEPAAGRKTGRGWPRGETQSWPPVGRESWPRAKEQGEELDGGGAGLGAGEVA